MVAPVIALLVIALVSLLAVRVAATALMMTGLSWDTASFQAYSAFFGVGFTTKEAELVVNHPVRRRIIALRHLQAAAADEDARLALFHERQQLHHAEVQQSL